MWYWQYTNTGQSVAALGKARRKPLQFKFTFNPADSQVIVWRSSNYIVGILLTARRFAALQSDSCWSVCSAFRKTSSDSNQLFPASHRSAAHTHTRTRSRRRQEATHTHTGGSPISWGKQHSLNCYFSNAFLQSNRIESGFLDVSYWQVQWEFCEGETKTNRTSIYFNKERRGGRRKQQTRTEGGFESMEYFMMPTEKIQSLQQFKKSEKDVIGGLCRCAKMQTIGVVTELRE